LKKLKEYDKALEYYQKSIDYSHNIQEEDINKLYAKINIAELHKTKGNYTKVFDVYDELLKAPDLFEKDPASYGAILCNVAYTMYLSKDKNTKKIDSLFTEAHDIFEDLQLNYELSSSS